MWFFGQNTKTLTETVRVLPTNEPLKSYFVVYIFHRIFDCFLHIMDPVHDDITCNNTIEVISITIILICFFIIPSFLGFEFGENAIGE